MTPREELIQRLENNRASDPTPSLDEYPQVQVQETTPGSLQVGLDDAPQKLDEPQRQKLPPARLLADPEGFDVGAVATVRTPEALSVGAAGPVGQRSEMPLSASTAVFGEAERPIGRREDFPAPGERFDMGEPPADLEAGTPPPVGGAFPLEAPAGLESMPFGEPNPFLAAAASPRPTTAMSDMLMDGMAIANAEATMQVLGRYRDSMQVEFDLIASSRGLF